MPTGQCHCGAIRYEISGTPVYSSLCHCSDCRRHAGAPMVAWTAYPAAVVPQMQVQVAERIGWMQGAHQLPAFDRYPSRG